MLEINDVAILNVIVVLIEVIIITFLLTKFFIENKFKKLLIPNFNNFESEKKVLESIITEQVDYYFKLELEPKKDKNKEPILLDDDFATKLSAKISIGVENMLTKSYKNSMSKYYSNLNKYIEERILFLCITKINEENNKNIKSLYGMGFRK